MKETRFIEIGPDFRAGLGIALLSIPGIDLFAHAGIITDGYQTGGGLALALGPVHLSGAASVTMGELDDSVIGMFALTFGGR